jgi:hypothetical protein
MSRARTVSIDARAAVILAGADSTAIRGCANG